MRNLLLLSFNVLLGIFFFFGIRKLYFDIRWGRPAANLGA